MNAWAGMIKFGRMCNVELPPNSWGSSTDFESRRSLAVLTRYGNLFTINLLLFYVICISFLSQFVY